MCKGNELESRKQNDSTIQITLPHYLQSLSTPRSSIIKSRRLTFSGHLAPMDENAECKPSSNFLQRTGCDHWGGRAQPGWRTFMMTCLHCILGYMRLEIWCKVGPSADWCLCTVLCTHSGPCCYWIGIVRNYCYSFHHALHYHNTTRPDSPVNQEKAKVWIKWKSRYF